VCKDLTIKSPALPVILSTSIPHYHQYEQHKQVIKQCANIVPQFLDGIQTLVCMSLNYISKLWFLCCNITLSQTHFKPSGLSPETNLGFIEVLVTSVTKNKTES